LSKYKIEKQANRPALGLLIPTLSSLGAGLFTHVKGLR
jgi:hypothetical protein